MIRVAIVEDTKEDAERLNGFLRTWTKENPEAGIETVLFSDAVQFIDSVPHNEDIVFMDIEMPHMNGMEAAEYYRKFNKDTVLIFLTHTSRYALRGYSVNAIDYIIKPISSESFKRVFQKAVEMQQRNKEQETVLLKTPDGVIAARAKSIAYFESRSHVVYCYTDSAVYKLWGKIEDLSDKLPEYFIRCHRSYIVNLQFVDKVTKDGISVTNMQNILIPLSRDRRAYFFERLTEYYSRFMRG